MKNLFFIYLLLGGMLAYSPGAKATDITDRGLVAIPLDDHRVFLSWRLLTQDGQANFRVERSTSSSGPFERIHTTNGITAYHDEPSAGTYYYRVAALSGSLADDYSLVVQVSTQATGRDYVELFPAGFSREYGPDNWGDTDGDGSLEAITRVFDDTYQYQLWELGASSPRWTFDGGKGPTPSQAYRRAQVITADFDGDQRDELIIDGKVGSDDTRFIMIEDNGSNATAKHDWDWPAGWANDEDHRQFFTYGNFSGGSRPGFVAIHVEDYRSTNWEMAMWEWNGTRMVKRWTVSHADTDNRRGSHQAIVADLDDDGRDEVVYGTVAIDHDGSILWDVSRETFGTNDDGDGVIIADIDAANPGYEIGICEEAGDVLALLDDATGRILYQENHPTPHINWITIADVDGDLSNGRSILGTAGAHELTGSAPIFHYKTDGKRYDWPYGDNIPFDGVRFNPIDWDGDQLLEMYMFGFDNNKDRELDNEMRAKIFGRNGQLVTQINNPKSGTLLRSGRYCIDLWGDHREEVIASMSDNSIRVYFNTELPPTQIRTKLQNNHYLRMINSQFLIQAFVHALGDFDLPAGNASAPYDDYQWLENKASGRVLGEREVYAIRTQSLNTSSSAPRWQIEDSNTEGYVWIKNQLTGDYLRINGELVTESLNPDYSSSKWKIETSTTSGYVWIKNQLTEKYLRVTGDGELVDESLNPDYSSSKWKLETANANGYVWIKNLNDQQYLQTVKQSIVTTTTLNAVWEGPKWEIEPSNTNGYVWIKNKLTGRYLRVQNDGTVITESLTASWSSFRWKIEPTSPNGYVQLRNQLDESYLQESSGGVSTAPLVASQDAFKWKLKNTGIAARWGELADKVVDTTLLAQPSPVVWYPNPAQQYVRVSLPNPATTALLSIQNTQGRTVLRQQVEDGEYVVINHLLPGLYLIRIQEGRQTTAGKLIVK